MFRFATAPGQIGWTPATFWRATLAELRMTVEGLRGEFQPGPFISRTRVAAIARAFGVRKSIRKP